MCCFLVFFSSFRSLRDVPTVVVIVVLTYPNSGRAPDFGEWWCMFRTRIIENRCFGNARYVFKTFLSGVACGERESLGWEERDIRLYGTLSILRTFHHGCVINVKINVYLLTQLIQNRNDHIIVGSLFSNETPRWRFKKNNNCTKRTPPYVMALLYGTDRLSGSQTRVSGGVIGGT